MEAISAVEVLERKREMHFTTRGEDLIERRPVPGRLVVVAGGSQRREPVLVQVMDAYRGRHLIHQRRSEAIRAPSTIEAIFS